MNGVDANVALGAIVAGRAELARALSCARQVVPTGVIDSLRSIRLVLGEGELEAAATNGELTVRSSCPVAGFAGERRIIHVADVASEVVARLRGDQVEIILGPRSVTFSCGGVESEVPMLVSPVAGIPPDDGLGVMVEGFVQALSLVDGIAQRDGEHPVFGTVLLAVGQEGLELVATDSRRLVRVRRELEMPPLVEAAQKISARAARTLVRLARGHDEVGLALFPERAVVRADSLSAVVRVVDGDYFDYRSVIEGWRPEVFATCERAELRSALDQVQVISPQHVELSLEEDKIILHGRGGAGGRVRAECAAGYLGEEVAQARFSTQLLGSLVSAPVGDEIRVGLDAELRRLVLESLDGSWTAVLNRMVDLPQGAA